MQTIVKYMRQSIYFILLQRTMHFSHSFQPIFKYKLRLPNVYLCLPNPSFIKMEPPPWNSNIKFRTKKKVTPWVEKERIIAKTIKSTLILGCQTNLFQRSSGKAAWQTPKDFIMGFFFFFTQFFFYLWKTSIYLK